MQLTTEQLKAAEAGNPVEIRAHGQSFVLLSHQAYEAMDQVDYAPVSKKELDRLASAAADLIEDSLDEPL